MNVVFLSPSYPPEMREYTRGLAEVGVRVFGIGEGPPDPRVLPYLSDYLAVPRMFDEDDTLRRASAWLRGRQIERVEANWEPLILLAARMREAWGIPGMSVDVARGFRDKQIMKERVAAAGLRVPYSARATSVHQIYEAADRIGFPLIIKPIDGAGSADTYRVDSPDELDTITPRLQHVPEVSVEEFIDGEEFTYDTICIDGRPAFENVAQYLPRPLIARTEEWISPVIITVRQLEQPKLMGGLELGRGVLRALGMGTGFTHMEWYLTSKGEVVFGEIGCRPGGAHLVDQMNYTCDEDFFRAWAEAVCWKRFSASTERLYNVAIIFKRAQGQGEIRAVQGLQSFMEQHGLSVCTEQLLRPGQHRRNWKQTLLSDGFVILRNPSWDITRALANDFAERVQLIAS